MENLVKSEMFGWTDLINNETY